MDSPLSYPAEIVSAYIHSGETGLAELADEIEEEAHDRPGEKFGKTEAVYLPQAPIPPTLWRTSCGRCRFWEEGAPGEPGQCHIVGREGDPYGGEAIHYRGWCAFWTPPKGEPPFAWIKERLRPDGKSSIRGVYDPELTRKEHRRQSRGSGSTEPAARRDAIRGGSEAAADDDATTIPVDEAGEEKADQADRADQADGADQTNGASQTDGTDQADGADEEASDDAE